MVYEAAREIFPKRAGDVERDFQSLGPLGNRLHAMTMCHTVSSHG